MDNRKMNFNEDIIKEKYNFLFENIEAIECINSRYSNMFFKDDASWITPKDISGFFLGDRRSESKIYKHIKIVSSKKDYKKSLCQKFTDNEQDNEIIIEYLNIRYIKQCISDLEIKKSKNNTKPKISFPYIEEVVQTIHECVEESEWGLADEVKILPNDSVYRIIKCIPGIIEIMINPKDFEKEAWHSALMLYNSIETQTVYKYFEELFNQYFCNENRFKNLGEQAILYRLEDNPELAIPLVKRDVSKSVISACLEKMPELLIYGDIKNAELLLLNKQVYSTIKNIFTSNTNNIEITPKIRDFCLNLMLANMNLLNKSNENLRIGTTDDYREITEVLILISEYDNSNLVNKYLDINYQKTITYNCKNTN